MDAKRLERFFLEAMAKGWARPDKEPWFVFDRYFSDYKIIAYRKKELELFDRFHVGQQGFSSGTTEIRAGGMVVWAMHYMGRYDKKALPIVKAALYDMYSTGIFNGGRGPFRFSDGSGLVYQNKTAAKDATCFTSFGGREEVWDRKRKILLGYHEYLGGRLFGK